MKYAWAGLAGFSISPLPFPFSHPSFPLLAEIQTKVPGPVMIPVNLS